MNRLFTDNERATLNAITHSIEQACQGTWWDKAKALFNVLVAAFVMAFEWELSYTLFSYIGDGDDATWNPTVMGASALILVLGFHYMLETRAGQKSKRFIEWLAAKVMPIYALGFGLVTMMLLFKDGLLYILQPEEDTLEMLNTITQAATGGDWLGDVLTLFVSPAAALSFAIGVATLAVINVAVAHRAIGKVKEHLGVIERNTNIKRHADVIKAKLKALEAELKAKQQAMTKALINDEEAIAEELAADIHGTLQRALLRPQLWLERERSKRDGLFGVKAAPSPRLKVVAEKVKAFEAVTLEHIIDLLQNKRKAK